MEIFYRINFWMGSHKCELNNNIKVFLNCLQTRTHFELGCYNLNNCPCSFAILCVLTDRMIYSKNFPTFTCMIVFTFPEAVPPATPITKGLGTLSLSNPFFLCQLLVDPAAIIWKFEFVAKYLQHFNIFWRNIIANSLNYQTRNTK